MQKDYTFYIDSDIYEKFRIALDLTKEGENSAIEQCLKWYISRSFEKALHTYSPNMGPKGSEDNQMDFYGMANRRIPIWAMKPNQYNHKIIRAFFMLEQITGKVTLEDLDRLCTDKAQPETYVPTFRSNYAQMKLDAPKSHGKVFEDDGETVWIWSAVKDTLMKHRTYFVESED